MYGMTCFLQNLLSMYYDSPVTSAKAILELFINHCIVMTIHGHCHATHRPYKDKRYPAVLLYKVLLEEHNQKPLLVIHGHLGCKKVTVYWKLQ